MVRELETRNYMRLKHQLAMILDSQGRLDEAVEILLDRPAAAYPIWHGIDTSEPPRAKDYAGSFGNLWMADKRARVFLRRFWDDEETRQDVTRLVSLGKLLLQLRDLTGRKSEKQWAGLIADRRAIEESPPSPETVRRVIRALGL